MMVGQDCIYVQEQKGVSTRQVQYLQLTTECSETPEPTKVSLRQVLERSPEHYLHTQIRALWRKRGTSVRAVVVSNEMRRIG
jgi:hypothetical protein